MDEGKRALMCFSPIRTLHALAALAPRVPAYSTVGVSQALLDAFVTKVLPRFTQGPIILVTSDYNSDRSAPQPFATDHAASLLADSTRIAHWFSDNWHQVCKGLMRHNKIHIYFKRCALMWRPWCSSAQCFAYLEALTPLLPLGRKRPVGPRAE